MIVTPIKIQGKKTKLIERISEISNAMLNKHPEIDTWVEPFLGSGMVAFNCPNNQIKKVIVNDINLHIIQFYECVNDGVITGDMIREIFKNHSRNLLERGYDYYNEVKYRFNKDFNVMDFLFLTRTGFNGVMRFNSKGQWNVPFCKLNDRLSDGVIEELATSVDQLSELFKTRTYEFHCCSFEEVIAAAPENSIFYCDPPYYGLDVQYYKGWCEDQEVMLNQMLKGKTFIYSTWENDGHKNNPMIKKLWSDYVIDVVDHKYKVAAKASDRMKMTEALIYTEECINKLW